MEKNIKKMRIMSRISAAVILHKRGSSSRVWAAHSAVEKSFKDGVILSPPQWINPSLVLCDIGDGEWVEIDIKAMTQ